MAKREEYAVILVENEDLCAIKEVSQNTFNQIKDMQNEGKDGLSIVKGIVELSSREDNLISNGLSKGEAIERAKETGYNYLSLDL